MDGGNKMKIKQFMYLLLILFVMLSGCSSSETYKNSPPVKNPEPINTDKLENKENTQPPAPGIPAEAPVNTQPKPGGKKVVYLTFDDGPSSDVTLRMLDILKQNKIHGTFFVVGSNAVQYKDVVKRIKDEGNALGLHGYTHNLKKSFTHSDEFINEMLLTQKEINTITGLSPVIIRFPGGTPGRMTQDVLTRVHERGFKIYDWNVTAGDGTYPNSSLESLYVNATKTKGRSTVILLMHCRSNNVNTAEVLPRIIDFYRNSGYEFKVITQDVKEMHVKCSSTKK